MNAEAVGVLATLRAGAYLALDRRFSRLGFWEIIGDRKITWINAVPAIISIRRWTHRCRGSPRCGSSGPRPCRCCSPRRREIEDEIGVPIVETYGMTEAATITANPVYGRASPARPGEQVAGRVEASDGIAATAGQIGRVKIRGAGVITAYDSGGLRVINADGVA